MGLINVYDTRTAIANFHLIALLSLIRVGKIDV